MKIENYFATPFLHKKTNEIKLCEDLEKFILQSISQKHRVQDAPQQAHPDLFESSFDFLNWNTSLTNELKKIMLSNLMEFIQKINIFDTAQLKSIRFNHESWFHVVKNGGYFQTHTHPNHSWSMVFCVNPGDANNKFESGHLLFIDPRLNASMYLDPANNNMRRDYSFNGFKIAPQKSSLLIFPSYLQHSVEPYIGSKHRITVAANFRFHFK